MLSVNEKNEFVAAYLEKYKHRETLAIFKKSKLSFEIIKPPKKQVDETPVNDKVKRSKKEKVPEEFKKLAKRAGIDPDLYEFFYKRRNYFTWSLFKPMVHCTEKNCNFKTEYAAGCLEKHMIDEHGFEDVPCQKSNCKFIAYSKKTLAFHMSRFHNFRTRKSSGKG